MFQKICLLMVLLAFASLLASSQSALFSADMIYVSATCEDEIQGEMKVEEWAISNPIGGSHECYAVYDENLEEFQILIQAMCNYSSPDRKWCNAV